MDMLLTTLALTPTALTRIVDQVKPDRYKDKLKADRFNLTEMVAHVADMEDVILDRLRLALSKPGSSVQGIDPDVRAQEHHYHDKDLHHELQVFANRRRDTIEFLTSVPKADWDKTIKHSEYGEMSIAQIAQMLALHDLYHLEQASEYMH
jgi:hypothetical protein